MPVTIEEFMRCEKDTALALRERLEYLQENRNWTVPKFVKEAGLVDTDEVKLRRFIKEHENYWDKINTADYRRLVRFLFDNRLWQDRDFSSHIKHYKDNLYHSLIDFLQIGPGTEDNMRSRVPGLYRVWRYSIAIPGEYAVGSARIRYEEDSGALCVTEVFSYEDDGGPEKLHFSPQHDEYFGYLSRKNKKYFIISRNKSVSTLQMTMLPDVYRAENEVTTMSGIVQGMSGSRLFTSRIMFERFGGMEDELKSMVGIYPQSKIPKIVLAVLDKKVSNDPSSLLIF